MKNNLHKNNWIRGAVKLHMEPSLIPQNKGNNDTKQDKYDVKTKLRRDPTSEKSDLYEFKIVLFENKYPEDLLL